MKCIYISASFNMISSQSKNNNFQIKKEYNKLNHTNYTEKKTKKNDHIVEQIIITVHIRMESY